MSTTAELTCLLGRLREINAQTDLERKDAIGAWVDLPRRAWNQASGVNRESIVRTYQEMMEQSKGWQCQIPSSTQPGLSVFMDWLKIRCDPDKKSAYVTELAVKWKALEPVLRDCLKQDYSSSSNKYQTPSIFTISSGN